MLSEQWRSSLLNIGAREVQLKKDVIQVYYNLLYLLQKQKLLQRNDSIYAEFLRKASLRFDKGESNVLEKITAENQRGQIGLQLSQLQQDMDLLEIQFQLLLNTTTVFIPDEKEFKMNILLNADTSLFRSHPYIKFLKQQQLIAAAATQVEKSKLLPDLTLGYNLMSIKGTAANNKVYNSTPQFQAVQVGLGIPIFTIGQRARINAARANEDVVASEYDVNVKTFESGYKTALTQYKKYTDAIAYYETTALKNADVITSTANKQFLNGDITYLDWVVLINQAVMIQNDYIETVKNRNTSVIDINTFTSK